MLMQHHKCWIWDLIFLANFLCLLKDHMNFHFFSHYYVIISTGFDFFFSFFIFSPFYTSAFFLLSFSLISFFITECIFVKSEGGTYSYISPGGNTEVCGLYVISEPDQVVGFEFEYFDISCSKGGLVSVIDGWELNGQFFPGSKDHLIPKSQRYNEFCGSTKPRKPFKASQNVGLIEFRIPIKGEGFKVKVKFHSNPKRKFYFFNTIVFVLCSPITSSNCK